MYTELVYFTSMQQSCSYSLGMQHVYSYSLGVHMCHSYSTTHQYAACLQLLSTYAAEPKFLARHAEAPQLHTRHGVEPQLHGYFLGISAAELLPHWTIKKRRKVKQKNQSYSLHMQVILTGRAGKLQPFVRFAKTIATHRHASLLIWHCRAIVTLLAFRKAEVTKEVMQQSPPPPMAVCRVSRRALAIYQR